MDWDEKDIKSDYTTNYKSLPRVGGLAIMAVATVTIIFASIWSTNAELDIITHGQGTVIPSSQTRQIQHNIGGIVTSINVNRGDRVSEGQILVKLRNPSVHSELEQVTRMLGALDIKKQRIEAEIAGKAPEFSDEDIELYADFVQRETELYIERSERNSAIKNSLEEQIKQKDAALKASKTRLKFAQERLDLVQREYDIIVPRVRRGILAQTQLLEIEKQLSDVRNLVIQTEAEIPNLEAAYNEVSQQLANIQDTTRAQLTDDLAKTNAQMVSVQERAIGLIEAVEREDVKSNVNGAIKELNVSSVGDVVAPNDVVLEIVPIDDKLSIEVRLSQEDRGQLKKGDKASVSISAYDSSIYGKLGDEEGEEVKVESISPDLILDEKTRQEYFEVIVSTNVDYLTHKDTSEKLYITPGMSASVDIQTGRNTFWKKLQEPIRRLFNTALREN